MVSVIADEFVAAVGPDGGRDVYMRRIAALMLSRGPGRPGRTGTGAQRRVWATERITEAHAPATAPACSTPSSSSPVTSSGYLDGSNDGNLHEWLADKDLVGQFDIEGTGRGRA